MGKNIKKIIFFLVIFTIFSLDFGTKWLAINYFSSPYKILNNFFRLEYRENYGIAFSIPFSGPFLIIVNFLLLGFFIYFAHLYLREKKFINSLAFSLIIGGALGNIWERLSKGYVVDFIAIGSFPVFNIADAALTIGALILILQLIIKNNNYE